MVSGRERHTAAVAMREEAEAWRDLTDRYPDVVDEMDRGDFEALVQDVAHHVGLEGEAPLSDVFGRLAEMVDPTCLAVTKDNLMETEGRGDAWAVCSGCGALLAVLADGDGVPRYCPGCGARVVPPDGGDE